MDPSQIIKFDTTGFTSGREFRHAANASTMQVLALLSGRVGLTDAEVAARLEAAGEVAANLSDILTEAQSFHAARDYEAYMADKEAMADVSSVESQIATAVLAE